jgi:hypothetical protein
LTHHPDTLIDRVDYLSDAVMSSLPRPRRDDRMATLVRWSLARLIETGISDESARDRVAKLVAAPRSFS